MNLNYSARRGFVKNPARVLLAGALLAPLMWGAAPVRAQSALTPGAFVTDAPETKEQRDARMAWWREAKFGMFIHWGVYAVPAGFYKDKPVGGIGEWIMNRGKIPVAEYREFAKGFTAAKYDPEAWVLLAKEAGMKYVVITSKHHDGFTLFPSKASAWGVGQSPANRDLLKPLAEACKKHGLKLGLYYSQAQDWTNPGGAAAGGHWDKAAQDGDMDEYIKNVAVPQVKEIMSNYGPDVPAVVWWDTPTGMNFARAEAIYKAVRELKPNIIQNNRLGGGFKGDTETPEQHIPATGFKDRDWETCMTLNNTWGFKKDDDKWKPTETLLRNLIDIASKGGNYLLNVGPTAEGEIPQASIDRLKEVGAWMKVNGAAIYGSTASPFKKLDFGRATVKREGENTRLFLHVFNWPTDGKLLVPGLNNEVLNAGLLADSKAKVAVAKAENGVALSLPAAAPDKISSTVVLLLKGAPDVTVPPPTPLTQKADGSLTLPVAEATLHGELKVENLGAKDHVGYWTSANDWLEWSFVASKPGKYALSTEVASVGVTAVEVSCGTQKITTTIPDTGDYKKFIKFSFGPIDIAAPGKYTLQFKPVAKGWKPFNLRNVELKTAP